jgi:hypothetical protein
MTKISLENDVIEEIYYKSRPQQSTDQSKHKRSGSVQKFSEHISISTAKIIDGHFSNLSTEFIYCPAETFY